LHPTFLGPQGSKDFIKDFIKRQISSKELVVQDVEIISAADADSVAKTGSSSSLNQNPPSPGVPTVIFLTQ